MVKNQSTVAQERYKVSAVSYLNTLPFLYGLENDPEVKQHIELSVDYPSRCAEKLLTGQVHIGLVPVVALLDNPQLAIVSDYCIGSDGEVASVFLFSNRPLEQITEIYLDYQSRTSVNLVKILAREYWKISPRWLPTVEGFERDLDTKAAVVIGDRAFRLREKAKYAYDLSLEWKRYTGLPFVFAVWAANTRLDPAFVRIFNRALEKGIRNIDAVLEHYRGKILRLLPLDEARTYLTKHIDYRLDPAKHKAIKTFLGKVKVLKLKKL